MKTGKIDIGRQTEAAVRRMPYECISCEFLEETLKHYKERIKTLAGYAHRKPTDDELDLTLEFYASERAVLNALEIDTTLGDTFVEQMMNKIIPGDTNRHKVWGILVNTFERTLRGKVRT